MDSQPDLYETLLAAASEMSPQGLAAPPGEFSNAEIAAAYVPLIKAFTGEKSGLAMARRAIHLHIAAVHDETLLTEMLRRELEAFQLLTKAQELVAPERWTKEGFNIWLHEIVRPALEKTLGRATAESERTYGLLESDPQFFKSFRSNPAAVKEHSRLDSEARLARLALRSQRGAKVAQLSPL
jgi:hypothetical protein